MDVGFVGLGQMGMAMARNLLKGGHTVVAYNRTRTKAEALAKDGATIADTPAAAARTGIVIMMLANDHAATETIEGADGALAGLPEGGILINMSTVSVHLTHRLAATHSAAGKFYVAAPVFGRPDRAADGGLFIAVAGPKEAVEKILPLLAAMGKEPVSFGDDPAHAATVKIAGNFMLQAAIEATAEALALVRKHGVDPASYLDFMTSSIFTAPLYKSYGGAMVEGKFEPAGFAIPLALKDTRLAIAAAEDVSTPLPLADLVRDRFLIALSRGWDHLDQAALGKLAAENAGLED
jgi:3-hydroxyisobutyrate dehydrogenase-like beta-hydroxyacid dehydrogenase